MCSIDPSQGITTYNPVKKNAVDPIVQQHESSKQGNPPDYLWVLYLSVEILQQRRHQETHARDGVVGHLASSPDHK
jgi:hypothetical protein